MLRNSSSGTDSRTESKEGEGLKKLNVTDLVDLEVTVNKMKELQLIDETMTNYRNLANAERENYLVTGSFLGFPWIKDCYTDILVPQRLVITKHSNNLLFQKLSEGR